jgi:stearoyl-CoA desaturase (delta-9 desaturase)
MSGAKPFETNDQSRNNMLCAILSLGEGWHNNHHAFPTSARHGLRNWEFDLTYLMIRLSLMLGLSENLKIPSPEALQSRMKVNQF